MPEPDVWHRDGGSFLVIFQGPEQLLQFVVVVDQHHMTAILIMQNQVPMGHWPILDPEKLTWGLNRTLTLYRCKFFHHSSF